MGGSLSTFRSKKSGLFQDGPAPQQPIPIEKQSLNDLITAANAFERQYRQHVVHARSFKCTAEQEFFKLLKKSKKAYLHIKSLMKSSQSTLSALLRMALVAVEQEISANTDIERLKLVLYYLAQQQNSNDFLYILPKETFFSDKDISSNDQNQLDKLGKILDDLNLLVTAYRLARRLVTDSVLSNFSFARFLEFITEPRSNAWKGWVNENAVPLTILRNLPFHHVTGFVDVDDESTILTDTNPYLIMLLGESEKNVIVRESLANYLEQVDTVNKRLASGSGLWFPLNNQDKVDQPGFTAQDDDSDDDSDFGDDSDVVDGLRSRYGNSPRY